MTTRFNRWRTTGLPVALAALCMVIAGVQNAHAILAGRVSSLQGDVTVTRLGELNARPVSPMMEVHVNDQIVTGTDGRIRILFTDDSVVSLAENSKLRISKQVYNPAARQRESVIDLFRGRVRSVVSRFLNTQINRFEIRTPTAVAGVRGSDIITGYDEGSHETTTTIISGMGYMQGLNGENFTNIDAGSQGHGTGGNGFSTNQLNNSQMQQQQHGFDTDQSGSTSPQTHTGNGSGGNGNSNGNGNGTGNGSSNGNGTGTGTGTGSGSGSGTGSDSGPLTNNTSGNTEGSTTTDQQQQQNTNQPTLTVNDLHNSTAPSFNPIQLEPPPSFSNVRAVITLH